MAIVKVRYMTARGSRLFWQPSGALRTSGWRLTRLPDAPAAALKVAQEINAALDEWRKTGTISAPTPAIIAAAPITEQPAAKPGPARKGKGKAAQAPAGKATAPAGTLSALINAYRKGDAYPRHPKTQKGYEENLRALEKWDRLAEYPPISAIGPRDIKALHRALAETAPTKAKAVCSMARLVFGWGMGEQLYQGYDDGRGGLVALNPAAALKLPTPRPERSEADLWTADDIAAISAAADAAGYPSIGLAVRLNAWCGQRQGDILRLKLADYRDGALSITQGKTRAKVYLPVDMIDELRADLSQITTDHIVTCETTGKPWAEYNFRHRFRDICRATGLPELAEKQFLTLRHTAVVRLAEAGCQIPEIASITGHTLQSVTQILDRYHVRTRKQAAAAFGKRLKETKA